jgi:hypothetical protein
VWTLLCDFYGVQSRLSLLSTYDGSNLKLIDSRLLHTENEIGGLPSYPTGPTGPTGNHDFGVVDFPAVESYLKR